MSLLKEELAFLKRQRATLCTERFHSSYEKTVAISYELYLLEKKIHKLNKMIYPAFDEVEDVYRTANEYNLYVKFPHPDLENPMDRLQDAIITLLTHPKRLK